MLRDEVDRLRQQLNKSAANVRQIEAANTTRVVNMKGTVLYIIIFLMILWN